MSAADAEAVRVDRVLWRERRSLARRAAGCTVDASHPESDEARMARHVEELALALIRREPRLFVEYVRWENASRQVRGRPPGELWRELDCLARELGGTLGDADTANAAELIRAASRAIDAGGAPASIIPVGEPLADLSRRYLSLCLGMHRREALALVHELAASGVAIQDLYLKVFTPAQREVGRLWDMNAVSVADEHFCTAVTQLAIAQLSARIFSVPRVGRTVLASSAEGELHELGMRMIADLFELAGWDSIFLGASTPSDAVVATVREQRPDLVALSLTLPEHAGAVCTIIDALRADPATASIPILVGGRALAVDPTLKARLGADAIETDAAKAVEVGAHLVEER